MQETTEKLEHSDLTERIIGAAIAVHRKLGPGYLESFYENALAIELTKRGIPFRRQVDATVFYEGIEIGSHRLDMLIDDVIVVELKAIKDIDDVHFAIVRSYLKALRLKHGLILNFAQHPLQIKRVIFEA